MSLHPDQVLIGAPNQLTTGAIKRAPLNTALPIDARTPLNAAFMASGYVSEDGLKLTPTYSTTDIIDWSGAVIRTLLESFNGKVNWTSIQMGEQELKNSFGDDNVTVTPASTTHGTQMALKIGNRLPPPSAWDFDMKDGENLIRIVAPRAQMTSVGEIAFIRNAPIGIENTLSCYADASGNSIYIYTDDGVFTA